MWEVILKWLPWAIMFVLFTALHQSIRCWNECFFQQFDEFFESGVNQAFANGVCFEYILYNPTLVEGLAVLFADGCKQGVFVLHEGRNDGNNQVHNHNAKHTTNQAVCGVEQFAFANEFEHNARNQKVQQPHK